MFVVNYFRLKLPHQKFHLVHTQHHKPSRWQIDAATPGTANYSIDHRRCDHDHPDGFIPTVTSRYIVDTSKNRTFRDHCHRFWIAAPAALAVRICDDIKATPECKGWGVIAVDERGTSALIPATTNTSPTPLAHAKYLGIIRAAADSGVNAIQRAYDRGYTVGRRNGGAA